MRTMQHQLPPLPPYGPHPYDTLPPPPPPPRCEQVESETKKFVLIFLSAQTRLSRWSLFLLDITTVCHYLQTTVQLRQHWKSAATREAWTSFCGERPAVTADIAITVLLAIITDTEIADKDWSLCSLVDPSITDCEFRATAAAKNGLTKLYHWTNPTHISHSRRFVFQTWIC